MNISICTSRPSDSVVFSLAGLKTSHVAVAVTPRRELENACQIYRPTGPKGACLILLTATLAEDVVDNVLYAASRQCNIVHFTMWPL